MVVERVSHNKALLSDKFSAALKICRRVRRYTFSCWNEVSNEV